MFKRFRFLISANLVAVLFVSTLILSKSESVKACPPPPPKTLLALYLQSEVIFIADVMDEKDGKIETDEEEYSYVEIIRNLKVSSVLKGKPPRNFLYSDSEYRTKKAVELPEIGEDETEIRYSNYGYQASSRIKVGEKYLFFFKKDAESNKYSLTDYTSGYKKLSDADLFIHKKRIEELKSITRNRENQLDAITKWLIRLIEEPSTRWDGVYDLNVSFESVENNEESEDEEDNDESETKESFIIDESFSSYTPEIAQNLSDSQKEYISTLAFSSFQQEIENNLSGYGYNLSDLAARWDKSRLAMYAFSFLQTVDKSDADKVNSIMRYLSGVLDDSKLYDIFLEYPVDDSSEQEEEIAEEETEIKQTETVDESENVTVEAVALSNSEETEKSAASEIEQNNAAEAEKSSESNKKAPPLAPAQKREKLLQDFINRYEYLLVRGFSVENDEELAESN